MANYIKSIEATGLYKRFDMWQEFYPDVNVLYGINGSGKTTLLHILANALNGDFERFVFLDFHTIRIAFGDGQTISIRRGKDSFQLQFLDNDTPGMRESDIVTVYINNESFSEFPVSETRNRIAERIEIEKRRNVLPPQVAGKSQRSGKILQAAYFPAFRTMIEAWISRNERESIHGRYSSIVSRQRSLATMFARETFGLFVPEIDYPSPSEIKSELNNEIRDALLAISKADRNLLSKAFHDIFATLSDQTGQAERLDLILTEIEQLLTKLEYPSDVFRELSGIVKPFLSRTDIEQNTTPILVVYRGLLKEMVDVEERSFAKIRQYLNSINAFLEGKFLEMQGPSVEIKFQDGYPLKYHSLSSGERQIVTMIYAATHMSEQDVVLIDEPEISLHIDWQRILLREMTRQIGERQIIVCTHSPEIGADHEDRMIEVKLTPTDVEYASPFEEEEEEEEEEEIPF